MAKAVVFIALQAIFIQTAFSQCVNRVVSNCNPNVLEVLPNQFFGPQGFVAPAPILPAAPAPILAPPVAIPECGYPTVIQDSSVANSLANALQLLVVSNLLSTTLPGPCEVPIPGYPGYPYESLLPALPSYNYVY